MIKLASENLVLTSSEVIKELEEHYDPSDVKQRPDGILYVETYKVIETFNKKYGMFWGGEVTDYKIVQAEGYKDNVNRDGTRIKPSDKGYKPCNAVIVVCNLYIKILDENNNEVLRTYRPGIGADEIRRVSEIDSHVKTALANAVKKSAINFGNMLYLWVEEERNKVTDGHLKIKDIVRSNMNKINDFAKEHELQKQDIANLISQIFKDGITIDGTKYQGNDKTVFYTPQQDQLIDYFIKKSLEICS